jgi:hypothetical protein
VGGLAAPSTTATGAAAAVTTATAAAVTTATAAAVATTATAVATSAASVAACIARAIAAVWRWVGDGGADCDHYALFARYGDLLGGGSAVARLHHEQVTAWHDRGELERAVA